MQTAYSRVTVVTEQRTIDLALPSALPLADVMPQVMRYAAPEQDDPAPATWTLGRVGGPTLQLIQTLEEAGVLDGDVLELRSQRDESSTAMVEDVRDAVEDSVDAAGGVWNTRTTASYAVLVMAVVLAALALVAALTSSISSDSRPARYDTPVGGAIAVAGLLFAVWWAALRARAIDAQVAAAVALMWGFLLGGSVVRQFDLDSAVRLVVAIVAMALVAVAARLITASATAFVAFCVVALAAVVLQAVGFAFGVPQMQGARALPVLGLLAVGVLPRVSLSVGGLASADYRVRHVGQLDLTTLRKRYRDSNAVLLGLLYGLSSLVIIAGISLDRSGEPWDRTLAVLLGAAAVLRSRLFSRTQHIVPLRVAGLITIGLVMAWYLVDNVDLIAYVVPAAVVAGCIAIGVASIGISEITRARVKRTLNIVEFVVIVTLVVVAAGALGLYGQVGGLFR